MAMPNEADGKVHEQPVGNLGKHEMPRKGQEHAETESFQGMLAADDRRPEKA